MDPQAAWSWDHQSMRHWPSITGPFKRMNPPTSQNFTKLLGKHGPKGKTKTGSVIKMGKIKMT